MRPKFWFISCVDSLLTIGDRHWRKLATTFQKPNQQIHFRLRSNGYLFIWGACFYRGAYNFTVCDSQLYSGVNSPKIELSSSMKLPWNESF